MTGEQALTASPAALNIEAHCLLGLKIERIPESKDANAHWIAMNEDGQEWSSIYSDVVTPTIQLLNLLYVKLFTESWDDARVLFEHKLWFEGLHFRSGYDSANERCFIVYDYLGGRILVEKTLPLAITRAFVLTNSKD